MANEAKTNDQGIKRPKGEEQPADKDRAQVAHRTRSGEPSPSREETGGEKERHARHSGHE